jgi:hypothetical protein
LVRFLLQLAKNKIRKNQLALAGKLDKPLLSRSKLGGRNGAAVLFVEANR